MDPEQDLEKRLKSLHAQYQPIDVTEKARWPLALAKCFASYKRSNLAIVGIVALAALDIYKPIPDSVMLGAFISLIALGVFGGARES